MLRKQLVAAGLSVLMLLSGSMAVMAEETAQSSVSDAPSEAVSEAAESAAAENAELNVAGTALSDAVADVADDSGAGEDTADIAAGQQANSKNDYASKYYFETYSERDKTFLRVMVEIENLSEDKNLYVSDATIDLEDSEGHLLRCINSVHAIPSIIYPGNTGYLYCSGADLEGIEDIAGMKVVPDFVIRSTNTVLHDYPDSDITFKVGGDRKIEANGRVTNDTDTDVSSMNVTIIYFDNDMQVLGISSTQINDVPAGATRSFGMQGISLYGDASKISNAVKYELFINE